VFSYKGVLAWGGGLMLVCAVSWIFAGLKENPHLADTLCSNCHLAGKQVDPAQAHKLVASQELLCGVCHASVKRMSHPSGFAPRGKLAAEYPLDWKGDRFMEPSPGCCAAISAARTCASPATTADFSTR